MYTVSTIRASVEGFQGPEDVIHQVLYIYIRRLRGENYNRRRCISLGRHGRAKLDGGEGSGGCCYGEGGVLLT